ncbi:hypothetical protein, partial [Mesorhizobium sp. LNHC229A00]|uniref:hypothetical protein n=1 Tax=Mesorhizobium sp. LNHC229A00 TaxID=1287240 RepID=UPI000518FE1C
MRDLGQVTWHELPEHDPLEIDSYIQRRRPQRFGLLAVFLAMVLGVALLPSSWGVLTAAQNNSVFAQAEHRPRPYLRQRFQ